MALLPTSPCPGTGSRRGRAPGPDAVAVRPCPTCGNPPAVDPCGVCADGRRDPSRIRVVEEVADLSAPNAPASFAAGIRFRASGRRNFGIAGLIACAGKPDVGEIIPAPDATVDGRTTGHYIHDCPAACV